MSDWGMLEWIGAIATPAFSSNATEKKRDLLKD